MLQRKSTIAVAAAGVTGAIAIAGVALAASHGTSYGTATSGAAATSTGVRTLATTVSGKSTTILTDDHGSPLYYYAADTATSSKVTGRLAGLWPPVTEASTPTVPGLTGTLTIVRDSHGSQLAYNGHLLYTFVSDRSNTVTGEGVENFHVATQGLASSTDTQSDTGGTMSGAGGY